MDLKASKKVHFIGIGGIGVSALAKMMLLEGKKVSGSDTSRSAITEELERSGAEIFYKHSAENLDNHIDLVIYTIAIPVDNPELKKAQEKNIKIISYPEALGEISKEKYTIAVSGTHGKTTTTAMIAKILIDAGLEPTVIVGSLMNGQNSNFIAGKGNILVVEACEYKKSFLNLHPSIIVITNIDADHLDFYKDLEDIKDAFKEFVSKLGQDGHLICNLCQENISGVADNTFAQVSDYSLEEMDIDLKIPGNHNYENAKAAITVAKLLSISENDSKKSLRDFQGTWRRFQEKGKTRGGATIVDDYAHHPTEIKATLDTARQKFGDKKIVIVFQPHLYSRTKSLLKDFAEILATADEVLVMPIYAAREKPDLSISNKILSEEINKIKNISKAPENFDEAVKYLGRTSADSVVITVGAGDVYKVGEGLVK